MIEVKFKVLNKNGAAPEYKNPGDAGADIRSAEKKIVPAGKSVVIGTGFAVGIPMGWEIQVRSRSGLAAKNGVFVLNSPGTVDSLYRDEVKVILFNTSDKDFEINIGDRIAQMVIAPSFTARFNIVEDLPDGNRGGGLGSTGMA